MIDFCAAISDTQADAFAPSRPNAAARVQAAAQQLAFNLIPRSAGVVAFAGGEIVAAITTALTILKNKPVQQALGATTVWSAVRMGARRWLREEVDVDSHVTRARSGLALLDWLSASLGGMSGLGAPAISDGLAVHAYNWMQATLTLHERGQQRRAADSPGI